MIKFTGDIAEIKQGAEILFGDRTEDLTINVKKEGEGLKIDRSGDEICICYGKKCEFFRAVVLLLEDYGDSSEVHIVQKPKFKTNGIMPDCAGGALNIKTIKRLIEYMARMGMNFLMLYTEDVFAVKDFPYFGYMRGRYSQEELRECDEYADIFGIEMVPCIETLSHLEKALRWDYTQDIQDSSNTLLVGEEKTYEFIEKMILAASAPFKSKRIHIGLDEARTLGLGTYMKKNGLRPPEEIFKEHIDRIMEIVRKAGLSPMMWSDMYFTNASPINDYYDMESTIPDEIINGAPEDIDMVYWDYYSEDSAIYRKMIQSHKRFKGKTIFAGGIWLWNGLVPHHKKTMTTTELALQVCKEEGVEEVFATIWGTQPDIYTALPGMQVFAEYGYQDEVDEELIAKRFKACTKGDYFAFAAISKLDYICDTRATNLWFNPSNPSTFLLWQHVMQGLFDKHIGNTDTRRYYEQIAEELVQELQKTDFKQTFMYYQKLAQALSLKADIGVRIKAAYEAHDKETLYSIAETVLPNIKDLIQQARDAHMRSWMDTRKPFGWELLDAAYGAVIACCETAMYRINAYLNNEIDCLEEMEEDRLFFGPSATTENGLCWNSLSFQGAFTPISIF